MGARAGLSDSVFVADPERRLGSTIGQQLQARGLREQRYADPGALLEQALRTPPRLVIALAPTPGWLLERLRHDPRTRGLEVVYVGEPADAPDAYLVLQGARVLVAELSELDAALERLLDEPGAELGGGELDSLDDAPSVRAAFLGRVNWVSDDELGIDVDLALSPGDALTIEGPLPARIGGPLRAVVSACERGLAHFDHGYRADVRLRDAADRAALAEALGSSEALAPERASVVVVAPASRLREVVEALDPARYALRWLDGVDALPATVARARPRMVFVDPRHVDVRSESAREALAWLFPGEPPLLPLSHPGEAEEAWRALGYDPLRDGIPPMGAGSLVDLVERRGRAMPLTGRERRDLRREHPFTQIRVVVRSRVPALGERALRLDVGYGLDRRALARLDLPPGLGGASGERRIARLVEPGDALGQGALFTLEPAPRALLASP